MIQRMNGFVKCRTYRAMWINIPSLIILGSLCSLAGMVVYAEYRRCDPLATDRIYANDQVSLCSNIYLLYTRREGNNMDKNKETLKIQKQQQQQRRMTEWDVS